MIKGDKLGEGTYGIVYDVKNNGAEYALKRNIAENDSSFISAIRELNILHLLKSHPNIVTLEGLIFEDNAKDTEKENDFSPLLGEDRDQQRNDNVHFMFDKGLYDLHDYIYNHDTKENYKNVKKYMVDCLLALEYMHHNGIIHRDLKPGNVLIYANNKAKLCDFVFSKPYTKQGNQTPGIITVCYRAPELLLSSPNYDFKVDVWSMGCLFYELVTKQQFIEEIEDDNEKLLKNVLKVLPVSLSKQEFINWIANNTNKAFKVRYQNHTNTLDHFKANMHLGKGKLTLFEKNCGSMNDFCNLLALMLKFNPRYRYSVTECLEHKFFSEYEEYIATLRTHLVPIEKPKIVYPVCIERKWMAQITSCLYSNKDKLEWYNPRCLFQAIDMFQRYLYTMHYYATDKVETELEGKVHNEFQTNLLFMACIYISIKYFSTIHYSIPFSDLVQEEFLTPECLKMVEAFEGGLIKNCFKYDVYHDTLYEAADCCNDILGDNEIKNLIYLFTHNDTLCDQLPEDVYRYYKPHLTTTDQSVLLQPYTKL
jgi:cyclin-dependent kinase 2